MTSWGFIGGKVDQYVSTSILGKSKTSPLSSYRRSLQKLSGVAIIAHWYQLLSGLSRLFYAALLHVTPSVFWQELTMLQGILCVNYVWLKNGLSPIFRRHKIILTVVSRVKAYKQRLLRDLRHNSMLVQWMQGYCSGNAGYLLEAQHW
jgi:hypothetical protein